MIGIWERGRERVVEHRGGFSTIDVMILEIGRRLRRIPRENHEASIASSIGNSPTLKRAGALAGGMDLDRDISMQSPEPRRSRRWFGLVEVDEPREVLEEFGR